MDLSRYKSSIIVETECRSGMTRMMSRFRMSHYRMSSAGRCTHRKRATMSDGSGQGGGNKARLERAFASSSKLSPEDIRSSMLRSRARRVYDVAFDAELATLWILPCTDAPEKRTLDRIHDKAPHDMRRACAMGRGAIGQGRDLGRGWARRRADRDRSWGRGGRQDVGV